MYGVWVGCAVFEGVVVVVPEELRALYRALVRLDLAELEFRRQVVLAAERMPLEEAAAKLWLPESVLTDALGRPGAVRMPAEGEHSASPYEVCQRYAAGELSREETIAILVAWPYEPVGDIFTSPGDDIMVIPEGTIHELFRAETDGLIDTDMCEAVRAGRHGGV